MKIVKITNFTDFISAVDANIKPFQFKNVRCFATLDPDCYEGNEIDGEAIYDVWYNGFSSGEGAKSFEYFEENIFPDLLSDGSVSIVEPIIDVKLDGSANAPKNVVNEYDAVNVKSALTLLAYLDAVRNNVSASKQELSKCGILNMYKYVNAVSKALKSTYVAFDKDKIIFSDFDFVGAKTKLIYTI